MTNDEGQSVGAKQVPVPCHGAGSGGRMGKTTAAFSEAPRASERKGIPGKYGDTVGTTGVLASMAPVQMDNTESSGSPRDERLTKGKEKDKGPILLGAQERQEEWDATESDISRREKGLEGTGCHDRGNLDSPIAVRGIDLTPDPQVSEGTDRAPAKKRDTGGACLSGTTRSG